MKFSDALVGQDISVSDDRLSVSRKEECDSVNSKTLVLQSQPITIRNQQSYILDLDMASIGFGKIGVMTQNPLNINIGQCNGLRIINDIRNEEQSIMISEFPLYDTVSRKLVDDQLLPEKKERVQMHLLLLLNESGVVHFFINFEHRGSLFVGLDLKYSWWFFFDLNGCLKMITATTFNGAPDQDMFEDEDGFKSYYTECARSSRLRYQANLVILQLSESENALNEILDRSAGTAANSGKVQLKAKCDYRGGQILAEGWSNVVVSEDEISKEIEQGFIGGSETSFFRENTNTVTQHSKNVPLKDKINLFEAEKLAEFILKKMKSKEGEVAVKKTLPNSDIQFSDLSMQLPNVKESTTPNEEIVSLVEGIISLFRETSCKQDVTSSCDKCKEAKRSNGLVQKTYSTELEERASMNPNVEIEVQLIKYNSVVQLQIMQCIGIREPGVYLVILDMDAYLMCLDNNEELLHRVKECLWLLYQRGPGQVAPQSVVIVLCYTKSTLDLISSEKMVHNIQLLKKLVSEICTRNEYRLIVKGEPIVLGPSSTNRAEKIYEIRTTVLNLIVNSPNVVRLVPEKWSRFSDILRKLSFQETKLMSFGQVCQVLEDQCNTGMENATRTLEYLSNLGIVPWIGDRHHHVHNRPESPTGSRIMEAQASVIVTDQQWLRDTVLHLEHDGDNECQSSERINKVLLSFSYHKLLFILLLKFPSLAVEDLSRSSLLTAFDFPLHSPTSSFTMFADKFADNELTIYFILNQPFPWLCYLSLLLACTKMSSNFKIQPFECASAIQRFDLEDKHGLEIFRTSENVIGATISCHSSRRTHTNIVARVRQFVERHMHQLSSTSSHRLAVHAAIRCTCSAPCVGHRRPRCTEQYSCMHFLQLDEVLCNHVVYCGPRRIPTAPWRERFPPIIPTGPPQNTRGSGVPSPMIGDHDSDHDFPAWMLKVSKVLNMDDSYFNWKKLALKLGYKNSISSLEEEVNPTTSLLADWMTSSGYNQLSMDFLILTLQEAGQYHISDIIEADPECHKTQAQIFISYQWHSQPEAKKISEYLNKVGFATWMDVGQMGGGDLLMHRIERAIRHCKALIACVTPRYVVSTFCHRELVLGDLLKKPIIPVMISSVPWPPPGGTGLLLAPYVYIDMYGVGGHGGSGLKSDISSRYAEIETQVSKHCIRSQPIPDLQRHPIIKIAPPQTMPSPTTTPLNGTHHNITPQLPDPHGNSAFMTHMLPVPSQTSVRECSSICTLI